MKEEKRKSFLTILLPWNKNTNSIQTTNTHDNQINKHRQDFIEDQYRCKQKSVRVIKRIGRKQVISSFNAEINQQENLNKQENGQFTIKVTKVQQDEKQKYQQPMQFKKKLKRVGKKVWVTAYKQETDGQQHLKTNNQQNNRLLQPYNLQNSDQFSDFKQLSRNNSTMSDNSNSQNQNVVTSAQKVFKQDLATQLQNNKPLDKKNQYTKQQKVDQIDQLFKNHENFQQNKINKNLQQNHTEQVTSDVDSLAYKNQEFSQQKQQTKLFNNNNKQNIQQIIHEVNIQKMLEEIQINYAHKTPIKENGIKKQLSSEKKQIDKVTNVLSKQTNFLQKQYLKDKFDQMQTAKQNKLKVKKSSFIHQISYTLNKPRQSLRKQFKRQGFPKRESQSQDQMMKDVNSKTNIKKPLLPAYPFNNQKNQRMLQSEILKRKNQVTQQKLPVRIKKQNSITPAQQSTMTDSKVQLNKIKLRPEDKKQSRQRENKQNTNSMHTSIKKQTRKIGIQKFKNNSIHMNEEEPRMVSSLVKNQKKLQINKYIAQAKKQIIADSLFI